MKKPGGDLTRAKFKETSTGEADVTILIGVVVDAVCAKLHTTPGAPLPGAPGGLC
jgi:hypothetical protein